MATTTRDVVEHVAEIRARLEKVKADLAHEEARFDALGVQPDDRELAKAIRDEIAVVEKEIDDFQARDAR